MPISVSFVIAPTNESGKIIESENDIVIRIPLEDLKRAKSVMIIGGGSKRLNAIRGALNTGIVSHLLTDEITARNLAD